MRTFGVDRLVTITSNIKKVMSGQVHYQLDLVPLRQRQPELIKLPPKTIVPGPMTMVKEYILPNKRHAISRWTVNISQGDLDFIQHS